MAKCTTTGIDLSKQIVLSAQKDSTTAANSVAVAADALVIPVTHPYVAKTTGGDAEALTLADGSPGQVLIVNLTVDGNGDGTLTPATATGWATIVFADAGDQATLFFVDDTIGWVIIGAKGKAAPPVTT
jgi:hypothetical protein